MTRYPTLRGRYDIGPVSVFPVVGHGTQVVARCEACAWSDARFFTHVAGPAVAQHLSEAHADFRPTDEQRAFLDFGAVPRSKRRASW